MDSVRHFPLFPLGVVALPHELIPLQIFEERYMRMVERCLEERSEFGIVWMAEDGVQPIGCACEISEVIERLPDGRLQLIVRGTRPFVITKREEKLPYPAGTIEFLEDRDENIDLDIKSDAQDAYSELVEQLTDHKPTFTDFDNATSYEMAATLDLGLEAKQGLLDLRSEAARLRLLTRLFRSALKRLTALEKMQARAKSNGKVHFPFDD